jgi:putative oxidoreductase
MGFGTSSAWQGLTLNLLRIITGFLFLQHGAQKLFGMLGWQGPPFELFSLIGVAGILEFFGGVLVMLGMFTRPAAFLLSGMMAVAYWMGHGVKSFSPLVFNSFWPVVNGGELAALYCFVFLFLWTQGGGNFSLDGLLRKGKSG